MTLNSPCDMAYLPQTATFTIFDSLSCPNIAALP